MRKYSYSEEGQCVETVTGKENTREPRNVKGSRDLRSKRRRWRFKQSQIKKATGYVPQRTLCQDKK